MVFMTDRLPIQGKILYIFNILGSCGGLYIGIMNFLSSGTSLWLFLINFIAYLVLGIMLGTVAILMHNNERKMLLKYDENGDLPIARQKIYLFTPVIITLAYLIKVLVQKIDKHT